MLNSDLIRRIKRLDKRIGRVEPKLPGSGAALTVKEQDAAPTVTNVNTIKVTNGTLTDDGGGVWSAVWSCVRREVVAVVGHTNPKRQRGTNGP